MSYKVQKPSWQVSWADPPEIKKISQLECGKKEWKNLPPHYRQYPNKRCFFLFWGFPEHERERFSWKLWHCQTPPPLMRGKVFGFVFALDSSSTGSDVPAPSLSLGEESPSCGNGKSSQRPTRVTHLSKSLPDTQILKFPNTGCFFYWSAPKKYEVSDFIENSIEKVSSVRIS